MEDFQVTPLFCIPGLSGRSEVSAPFFFNAFFPPKGLIWNKLGTCQTTSVLKCGSYYQFLENYIIFVKKLRLPAHAMSEKSSPPSLLSFPSLVGY